MKESNKRTHLKKRIEVLKDLVLSESWNLKLTWKKLKELLYKDEKISLNENEETQLLEVIKSIEDLKTFDTEKIDRLKFAFYLMQISEKLIIHELEGGVLQKVADYEDLNFKMKLFCNQLAISDCMDKFNKSIDNMDSLIKLKEFDAIFEEYNRK